MKKRIDLSKITEQMIAQMEAGNNPWIKPWKDLNNRGNSKNINYFAYNYITNVAYSRTNQFGLAPGYYMTFKQVKDLGGNVKKGAKASWVYYTSNSRRKAKDNEVALILEKLAEKGVALELEKYYTIYPFGVVYFSSEDDATIINYVNKLYTVFHIDDCENYREIKREDEELPEVVEDSTHEEIDAIIFDYVNREGIKFINDRPSDRAFFRPSTDEVVMPMKSQFNEIEEYYSTTFHELTHSTGTLKRLNRGVDTKLAPFGSLDYSREELVAEMGACFAIGYLGLDSEKTSRNSAAYLKGWARELRGELKDKIIVASNQAAKAFDYIFEPATEDVNIKEDKDTTIEPVKEAPAMSASEVERLDEIKKALESKNQSAGMYIDFVTNYSDAFKNALAELVDFEIKSFGLSWERFSKKTLAELKRQLKPGAKLVMLNNFLTSKNNKMLGVAREIVKVQSNGIYLATPDESGKLRESWLDFPKADMLDYVGNTFTIYFKNKDGEKQAALIYKIEKAAA